VVVPPDVVVVVPPDVLVVPPDVVVPPHRLEPALWPQLQ
jgi:hypothetical protein